MIIAYYLYTGPGADPHFIPSEGHLKVAFSFFPDFNDRFCPTNDSHRSSPHSRASFTPANKN